jgi:glycosyltransferase involved in cell wall biosynthesis
LTDSENEAVMVYSVIIPIYNAEKYLKRCVDSVISQTNANWELILVDDGSYDSSPLMCDEYIKKYPEKMHVLHQENKGVLSARRAGIGLVAGDYICFLDSDDYWDSNFLEEIDFYRKAYNPDIMVFGYRKVGPQGEVLGEELPATAIRLYGPEEKPLVYEMISEGKLTCLWAQVVKSSIVDFGRDYSEYYKVFKGEDVLQNLALYDKASKVLFIPSVYYSYFTNVQGLTHRKVSISYLNSHVIVQEQILKYLEKWEMPTEQATQMFVGIFNRALKSFMQNEFRNPSYSNNEIDEILHFLSSGCRLEYLKRINIDWNKKRLSLCLWLLKKRQIQLLKMVLYVCRVLNFIKVRIRPCDTMQLQRKEHNVQN